MLPASIHVEPQKSHTESLTAALQALLRWAGGDARYADVHAVLGLAFLISARGPEHCLASWMLEGRDVFLAETAAAFGLRLRALHPPEAARGLEDSAEFAQHFDASYKPLIARALEHGQPVLARGAWAGQAGLWGVITNTDGAGFSGTSVATGSGTAALTAPAVQVYVVEDARWRVPDAGELWRSAIDRAQVVLQNRLVGRLDLTTGPEVFRLWQERLRAPCTCAMHGPHSRACQQALVNEIIRSRTTGAEFIRHHRGALPAPLQPLADRVAALCGDLISILSALADPQAAADQGATSGGRGQSSAALEKAYACERELRQAMADVTATMPLRDATLSDSGPPT
jgi:hypothetical protein